MPRGCCSAGSTLTWLRVSGLDLDGRAAPAVLLHLGHPLAGHLVGVVSGAHGDLVLDDALHFQLVAATAGNGRSGDPLEPQSSECGGSAEGNWPSLGLLAGLSQPACVC